LSFLESLFFSKSSIEIISEENKLVYNSVGFPISKIVLGLKYLIILKNNRALFELFFKSEYFGYFVLS
jgi:hypothetical protein